MNILFDLDGTLTDSSPGFIASIRHTLQIMDRPIPAEEIIRRQIGPPIESTIALFLGTDDAEVMKVGLGHYRQRYGSIGLFENSVYPSIEDSLIALRDSGARLFVATSKPHFFATQILDHFGLSPYFQAVYGSELDGTRANKTELIAYLLRRESLSAESTLMIGDRLHDAAGALNNGVTPIGVLWGFGSREELLTAGVHAICEHPLQLPDVIDRLRIEP